MVDKARFELATSALRRQRSTGLIYLPIVYIFIDAMDIKFSYANRLSLDKNMFCDSFNLYGVVHEDTTSDLFQDDL